MSEFIKYPHLERFGKSEVQGIEEGKCYIFPKLDGTNASTWLDEIMHAGSRKRQLSLYEDNAGFYEWTLKQENLIAFHRRYPTLRLYGEWMVPHTLKTYKEEVWKRFWVFDVYDEVKDRWLSFEEYEPLLKEYYIDYIPLLAVKVNPTIDELHEIAKKNTFMIADDQGIGEGIVIKRYDFVNRYGRSTWAKLITLEFNDARTAKGAQVDKNLTTEEKAVKEFCTEEFIKKEFAKFKLDLQNRGDNYSSKNIKELLGRLYNEFIMEESYNIIRKLKDPAINFKVVRGLVNQKIKNTLGEELFV